MNSSTSLKSHCKKRLLFAVVFTAILVVLFKMHLTDKVKSITKLLLFINSLVINDLSLRKYEGKFSKVNAFCLLLFQKFLSIILGKVLLYGEMPTLRDSSFLILLAVHFVTFTIFHSHHQVEVLMNKLKKSEMRIVIQETFKGYGKGLNLLKLVAKGHKLHTSSPYFLVVLLLRGSASALFKATYVSTVVKKPIKIRKAKINFLFITIPTAVLYVIQLSFKFYLPVSLAHDYEQFINHFFITFMVVSRCMRALMKVLKGMQGKRRKGGKKITKVQKKKNNQDSTTHGTLDHVTSREFSHDTQQINIVQVALVKLADSEHNSLIPLENVNYEKNDGDSQKKRDPMMNIIEPIIIIAPKLKIE